MKRLYSAHAVILFLFSFTVSRAQNIDSLKRLLKTSKHDTSRLQVLNALAESASDEEWPVFNGEMEELSKALVARSKGQTLVTALKYYSAALNNRAMLTLRSGDAATAIEIYTESLAASGQAGYLPGRAATEQNLGFTYKTAGDIPNALTHYMRALNIYEKLNDKNGTASTLVNTGALYAGQEDYRQALQYFKRGAQIEEEINEFFKLGYALNNIGFVYLKTKQYDSALFYFDKSLSLREKTGDKGGKAQTLSNIAFILKEKGNLDEALSWFNRCLKLQDSIRDTRGITLTWHNISGVYFLKSDYKKARTSAMTALKLAKELGFPDCIRDAAFALKNIYGKTGDHRASFEMYQLYIQMRDSIMNEQSKKASIKSQLKYEYEKKAAADSVKNAETQKVKDAQLQAQNARLKQEKTQFWFLVCGLTFVVAGLLFVVNRFRVTQKQKKIIEEQKLRVDEAYGKLHEKNKEVMDSIYYARRIQRALITNEKYIAKHLNKLAKP